MNIPDQQIAMSPQIQAYAELRQQIHGNLRIQHPDWVEPNGESSMRLMELLDTLTRSESNTETSQRVLTEDQTKPSSP